MKWDTKLYNEKHAFVYDYGSSLIELLSSKPHERILDLGCGTGNLTKQISDITTDVIGIDSSKDMVESAKAQFPELSVYQKDGANFKFDKPFDAIFSNATLHWILDYKSCIKSMFNNLKKGGRIVLEFGGKGNVQLITDSLRKHLKRYNYEEQALLNQWYFPSIGEYSFALEEIGFKVTFAQHFNRKTELSESGNGIKDWLEMFSKNFFKNVTTEDKSSIINDIIKELEPKLYESGKWYADYKRLRIVAIKDV